ncbi:hypothetical protein [Streptococcus marmotae]|nr:hypothetical protein [Streptococcus marmotae]
MAFQALKSRFLAVAYLTFPNRLLMKETIFINSVAQRLVVKSR